MWPRRAFLFRFLLLALAAVLVPASAASAAPAMCTDYGANPQGIVATHLLAKIDGTWVEPENVCVGAKVEESGIVGGFATRGLYLGVWNTVDGGFPETHLPPGTPISLGLRRPPGMIFQSTFGRWRGAVVVSNETETVIQGRTVPWDYHAEAYFGGPGLDCSLPPTTWPSTFSAYIELNPLNPDRSPNLNGASYAGSFYESNTVGAIFPRLNVDDEGNPTGLQVTVSGCGDGDPSTLEGFFDGFTTISIFRAFGITDELLQDAALLQGLIEIRDLTTGVPINATFGLVPAGGLSLEPVPGVTLPTPPAGSGIIGVRTMSTFTYSEHVLVQRGEPGAMAALRSCRSKGGTPAARDGQLICVPDTTPPKARLITRRSLKRGRSLVLSCNEPCTAVARLMSQGRRLASGRARSTTAGKLRVRMKLTPAGRGQLAARRSVRATIRATVSDRAGNSVRLKRGLRLTR